MTSRGAPKKEKLGTARSPHNLPRLPPRPKARIRIRGQKAGPARHVRKTSSPGTRRTLHSSHRHWAPPYWTTARTPPLANHRGAEVPAVLPDSKSWEPGAESGAARPPPSLSTRLLEHGGACDGGTGPRRSHRKTTCSFLCFFVLNS